MNTIEVLGEEQAFAQVINRTIQSFEDDVITSIGSNAFYGCTSLTTVNFPNVASIGDSAFRGCFRLTTASFPNATSIGDSAFRDCSILTTASFPNATSIGDSAFRGCTSLTTLILRANQVVTLAGTNAFTKANNCIFYVPDNLVDRYKAAQNWSTYASRIKGISELPAA